MPLLSLLSKPWFICLAIAAVLVYVLSTSIVKTEAILHPLHSEAKSVHKNFKVDTTTVKHPDGTIETHSVATDLGVTDSKKDEKPNTAAGINGGLWADVAYEPLTAKWHGEVAATLGPFMAGVENPVALEFAPKMKAGVRVLNW